jgi:hypothetical protein
VWACCVVRTRVKIIVWYQGKNGFCPPSGWALHSLSVRHSDVGRVTDGVFQVMVACHAEIGTRPPRPLIGVSATLQQILDPTVRGRACTTGEPGAGVVNTAKGLLNWGQRRGSVIAPTVFPWIPWVARPLSPSELLSALDVPAVIIEADVHTMKLWGRELSLPFKVWAEVRAWVCSIIGRTKRPFEDRVDPDAKRAKLWNPDVQRANHGVPALETARCISTDGDTPPQDNLTMMPKFRFTYGMTVQGETRT